MLKTILISVISALIILPAVSSVKAAVPLKNTAVGTREGILKKVGTQNSAIINGASLTSTSGTTLIVSYNNQTITVTTNDKTKFRRRFWGKGNIEEMKSGDILNIYGKWTDAAKTSVLAILVRDTSIQKRFGVFVGQVQTINDNDWVIETASRGTQTVTLSKTVKLYNRKGEAITQTQILAGHRIKIRGFWNKTKNLITDTTTVKDYNLPVVLNTKPSIAVKK